MPLLYSYPTAPTISVKCSADVQSMDANTLIYEQILPAMYVGEYNDMLRAMETAYLTAHADCWSSVPIAAILLHDAKSRTSPLAVWHALQRHKRVNLLFHLSSFLSALRNRRGSIA